MKDEACRRSLLASTERSLAQHLLQSRFICQQFAAEDKSNSAWSVPCDCVIDSEAFQKCFLDLSHTRAFGEFKRVI